MSIPAKLDEMYLRWQEAEMTAAKSAEERMLEEARFKGAVEALGAVTWQFVDGHVVLHPHADELTS